MEKDKDKRKGRIKDLKEKYPSVPMAIYDIEASEEMAEIYLDEFGY